MTPGKWVDQIRVAQQCPSCHVSGRIVSMMAADDPRGARPGFVRLSFMHEAIARLRQTLFGGTSFAFRIFVCRNCGHVLFYYDESVTYDLPEEKQALVEPGVEASYMARSGDGAQNVSLKYDPRIASFETAVEVARRHARQGQKVMYIGMRRVDHPGHPWVCEWTRRAVSDPWKAQWMEGATAEQKASSLPELSLGSP